MGRSFVAATSTLRAARSPPIILLARIFWAAPIAARRWGICLVMEDRNEEAFARFVSTRGDIDAMLGIGGGGGTFIVTKGMQSLRIGVPKLMVSTLAAGDVGRYVNVADISMMPSVTDLAGLNNTSRTVLRKAAFGVVGMASAEPAAGSGKPPIALTMVGVTTPCVTAVTEQLRDRFDCIVFHATGTAGRAMEKLANSAFLYGVIDVTTTEVCDAAYSAPARIGSARLHERACLMSARWEPSTW